MVSAKGIEEIEKVMKDVVREADPSVFRHFMEYFESQKTRLRATVRFLGGALAPDSRILEIGAMPYFLTYVLEKTFGCNIDTASSESGDLEKTVLPYPNRTFDAVMMPEVLEHLKSDPSFVLKEAHRVLKEGGILAITTPNARSITDAAVRVLLGKNANSAYDFPGRFDFGFRHCREFNTKELRRLLAEHNFKIEKVGTKNVFGAARFLPSPFGFGQSIFLAARSFGGDVLARSDWLYHPISRSMNTDPKYPGEFEKFLSLLFPRLGREKELSAWKRWIGNTSKGRKS